MHKRAWISSGLMLAAVSISFFAAPKRDAAPAQAWAARYNGAANGEDRAAAMALDASGNAYVVGSSLGSGTGTDIVTVKFDAAGKTAWAKLYDGPSHGDDAGKDIAVDAAGNVFIVGTATSAKGTDITTIKYSAAGKRLWVRTYDGTGHANDAAGAIAVDGEGSAIVCGTGGGPYFTVIKYGAKGTQLWIKTGVVEPFDLSAAFDVAVDGSNNIYACGTYYKATRETATVKLDKNGGQVWAKFYNGPGNQTDIATALVVTASGNVTITGDSERAQFNHDYLTVKYNKSGGQVWAKTYNGPANGEDGPTGIGLDALGNAYVTGWITVGEQKSDIATVKYGPTGRVFWTKTYDGPAENSSYDYGRAIAVDRSGNAYVAGESRNERAYFDIVTIMYSTKGAEAWVLRYEGPAQVDDTAQAIALDAAGAVYVAGTSAGIGTGNDIVVIKYK
jgi:hypothetical protein